MLSAANEDRFCPDRVLNAGCKVFELLEEEGEG